MPFYHCLKANVIILTPDATYSNGILLLVFAKGTTTSREEEKNSNSWMAHFSPNSR